MQAHRPTAPTACRHTVPQHPQHAGTPSHSTHSMPVHRPTAPTACRHLVPQHPQHAGTPSHSTRSIHCTPPPLPCSALPHNIVLGCKHQQCVIPTCQYSHAHGHAHTNTSARARSTRKCRYRQHAHTHSEVARTHTPVYAVYAYLTVSSHLPL